MCWKIQVQKKGRFFFFFPVGGGRHLIVSTIAFENQSSVAHVVNAILNLPWLWYVQNGHMYVSLSQIRGEEMQARGYVCVCVFLESHMKTWIRKCILSIALVTILPPALGRDPARGREKEKFVGSWKSWVAESTRPEIQPCSTLPVLQTNRFPYCLS